MTDDSSALPRSGFGSGRRTLGAPREAARYLPRAAGGVVATVAAALAVAAVGAIGAVGQEAVSPAVVRIGYLEAERDDRYEPIRLSQRVILKARHRPWPGAVMAAGDAQVQARVAKATLELERITVATRSELVAAMLAGHRDKSIRFFVVDAPPGEWRALAEAAKGRDILLFNATAGDDDLRRQLCSAHVVHTVPSLAMRMDALVQHVVSRKWRDVLVLEGPQPADAVLTTAFLASAKKLGARVVAHQKVKPGSDPREREQNNPVLLTAIGRDYDIVFVADSDLEFARELPYRMARPRPVVGSIDLEPEAWHWTFDRFGAPQVNGRFMAASGGRHMASADWAAWIAVKIASQAALIDVGGDFAKQKAAVLADTGFDGSKGLAVSFRRWDQQLRQPVLLTAPYAVVATAPMEGFLHQVNRLDTLGDDAGETPCRLDRTK